VGLNTRSAARPLISPVKRESVVFEEGKMMKKAEKVKGFAFCLFVLAFVLGALIFLPGGCSQLGETRAEARRRHKRALAINQQQMLDDIDKALLLDKPSKLTDKRIP